MNDLRKKMDEIGIAGTRQFYIEDALAACHRAFSPLDTTNRQLIVKHMPFLAQCARFYGLHMNACNTFEDDGIIMPTDPIKEILDNL